MTPVTAVTHQNPVELRVASSSMNGPGFSFHCAVGFLCSILVSPSVVLQQQTQSPQAETARELQTKAEGGDAEAQFSLARSYENGEGLPQNDERAVKWYTAAAEQGNAKAQNSLGVMFRTGRGVRQDKKQAIEWYKKSARQMNATAMFNLGTAYYNGDGVGADNFSAYAWFLLAESFGSEPAAAAVKRMKEERADYDPEAFEKIGDLYWQGDILPRNGKEALAWYHRAAEFGLPPMLVKLGSILLVGPNPEYGEARNLFEKAAKARYPAGMYCVGLLHEQGWGVDRNLPQAAKWFEKAATGGNAIAMLHLGRMYARGEGLKQDKVVAYKFMLLASAYNVLEAKQEKEQLEREMTVKEQREGKAKAESWVRKYRLLEIRSHAPEAN